MPYECPTISRIFWRRGDLIADQWDYFVCRAAIIFARIVGRPKEAPYAIFNACPTKFNTLIFPSEIQLHPLFSAAPAAERADAADAFI